MSKSNPQPACSFFCAFQCSSTSKTLALLLASSLVSASCASSTTIQSQPSGAKVYLNGELAGTTPHTHTDRKMIGSTTTVRLEKKGYETRDASFSRNEEVDGLAIVGGIFLLIPFLWTMKYKSNRTYELTPSSATDVQSGDTGPTNRAGRTKAERIEELKQLREDGVISEEDYDLFLYTILKEEE